MLDLGEESSNLKTSIPRLICIVSIWILMCVLVFQIKYYEIYLPNEGQRFGDLRYVLSCGGFDFRTYETLVCSDYMYGRGLLVVLKSLSILHPYGDLITNLVVIAGLLPVAFLFNQSKKLFTKVLSVAIFLSPPIALLLQRGNLDIFVFFFSWVAIKAYLKGHYYWALTLCATATAMKMYPLALFLLLGMSTWKKIPSVGVKIIFGVSTMILCWSTLVDIRNIPWLPSDARNSFGLRIFGEYWTYFKDGSGHQSSTFIAIAIGLLCLGVSLGVLAIPLRRQFLLQNPVLSQELVLWMSFFTLIFFSGISIDYRLVFLFPCVQVFDQCTKQIKALIAPLFFMAFLFSYPFDTAQTLGDIALFGIISFILLSQYNSLLNNGVLNFKLFRRNSQA